MADYSVSRSKHATLAAATVDNITFTTVRASCEVKNRGTSGDIYFRVDGTAPVSAADNTFFVGPGESLEVPLSAAAQVVKLISAGTPAYTVTGV